VIDLHIFHEVYCGWGWSY